MAYADGVGFTHYADYELFDVDVRAEAIDRGSVTSFRVWLNEKPLRDCTRDDFGADPERVIDRIASATSGALRQLRAA